MFTRVRHLVSSCLVLTETLTQDVQQLFHAIFSMVDTRGYNAAPSKRRESHMLVTPQTPNRNLAHNLYSP